MKNARDGKEVLAIRLDFDVFALFGNELKSFDSSDVFSDWTS